MKVLNIAYESATQSAVLSSDVASIVWDKVKAACIASSEEVSEVTSTSLSMPWWLFLRVRRDVGYILRRAGVGVTYEGAAKGLLTEARDRAESFDALKHQRKEVSDEEVRVALIARGFRRSLKDYQLRNVSKLMTLPMPAGASFSVPGAGKTTEALAFHVLHSPSLPLLVVCPKNAFPVWEEQVKECLPGDPNVVRLVGGYDAIESTLRRRFDFGLVTYQQVPYIVDLLGRFMDATDVALFLDESHRIKRGTDGVIARSLRKLAHLPKRKLILSGTPLPNAPADLVPQFEFLFPEREVDAEQVVGAIRPVFVRTTKDELNLPPVRRHKVNVRLTEAQQVLYDVLASEAKRAAAEFLSARDKMALRAMARSALRLIRVVSNPQLVFQDVEGSFPSELRAAIASGDSPKLDYVMRRARRVAGAGKKVLIWSSFVSNVEVLATRLADLGAEYIHGGVDAGSDDEEWTREYKIKRFHDDPACKVLVANPAACGEGISLHRVCHHAIYLDRTYNAAHYLQSEDRIHRIGLEEGQLTFIEIVAVPGTVDDSVNRRLVAKATAMARVLEDENLNIDPIPWDGDDSAIDEGDAVDLLRQLGSEPAQ